MNRREFKKYLAKGVRMERRREYAEQILEMKRRAQAWRKANPDKEVRVQFNFPKRVFTVAAISDAVNDHLVSCNEAGLELLKALWPWDDLKEPKVTMVKIALEL